MTTSDVTLQEWAGAFPNASMLTPLSGVDLRSLVLSGVPREDVETFRVGRAARNDLSVDFTIEFAAATLFRELRAMSEAWGLMPLPDAVGWVLVCQSPSLDVSGLPWDGFAVVDAVTPWAAVGLRDGWLFHAAGVTIAEARAQVAAGTVDVEGLTTLAVLRGAAVPAPR